MGISIILKSESKNLFGRMIIIFEMNTHEGGDDPNDIDDWDYHVSLVPHFQRKSNPASKIPLLFDCVMWFFL